MSYDNGLLFKLFLADYETDPNNKTIIYTINFPIIDIHNIEIHFSSPLHPTIDTNHQCTKNSTEHLFFFCYIFAI